MYDIVNVWNCICMASTLFESEN